MTETLRAPLRPHLPRPITPLIDRDSERALVQRLLVESETRLVTLTGTGGSGKTRLALELGQELAPHFSDGVAFVSVASETNATNLLPLVAQAIGVRDEKVTSVEEALDSAIRDRTLLFIMDNLEQLRTPAGGITWLLEHSPASRLLVTSRASLHLRG